MDNTYRLSVVLCAVDETFSLRDTFNGIDRFHLADEYLFVLSQTCTDVCLQTVRQLCEREDCRFITQSGRGFGNAIRDAIFEVKGSHMLLWSADGATDPGVYPELVRQSKAHPDTIVTVSRWLSDDGFPGYNPIRKIVNRVSQKMFALLYHSDMTDFTNPTQITPVEVYRGIRWERDGFDFLPELTFKPLKLGVPFIEVPGRCLPRREGKTHSRFRDLVLFYPRIWSIYRMDRSELLMQEDQS